MTKNTPHNTITEQAEQLQEIARMTFGQRTDEEIQKLLSERARLKSLVQENERIQKAAAELAAMEKKKTEKIESLRKRKQELIQSIRTLNQSISSNKTDDALIKIVSERKTTEQELKIVEQELLSSESRTEAENESFNTTEQPKKIPEVVPHSETIVQGTKESVPDSATTDFKSSLQEAFGREGIVENNIGGSSALHRYLDQLKNNPGSLGTLLEEMPLDAKKNKAFMLKVAEIDSAYAMHYADSTLKKEEDFNIRIASMDNKRHSGNAVAEMLPEARTSKVVLAAVKQDYRNIKFIQPSMEDYDTMLNIAKEATLQKIKDMQEAADVMLLIPRPLIADKQFMAEVEKITSTKKGQE